VGYGATLAGATQVNTYTDVDWKNITPSVLIREIAGVAGAVKSWAYSGDIATDGAAVTTGITYSQKFTFRNNECPLYLDWPFDLEDGESLEVGVYMKQDGTGRTVVPRCQIIRPDSDPILGNGTAVSEQIITDNTDWQTKTLSYTAVGPETIWVRVTGTGASGNFWAQVVRDIATGTSYDGPAIPKTVSGAMYPRFT